MHGQVQCRPFRSHKSRGGTPDLHQTITRLNRGAFIDQPVDLRVRIQPLKQLLNAGATAEPAHRFTDPVRDSLKTLQSRSSQIPAADVFLEPLIHSTAERRRMPIHNGSFAETSLLESLRAKTLLKMQS